MLTIEGSLHHRIYGEYREMPGLCLTIWQAAKLWGLDTPEATRILEQLERAGLLKRTAQGTYCLRDE
jgi:DNA-binding IclR family transcriptional regulator